MLGVSIYLKVMSRWEISKSVISKRFSVMRRPRHSRLLLLFYAALLLFLCMLFYSVQRLPNTSYCVPLGICDFRFRHTAVNESLIGGSHSDTTLLSQVDLPTYTWPNSTGTNCAKYKAVLHIHSGDQGAAAGTLFFQYMINQLIYAKIHKLIPWIHLDNFTQWVYDEDVHGVGSVSFDLLGGWQVPWEAGPFNQSGAWPGEPYLRRKSNSTKSIKRGLHPQRWNFEGRGVWNDYFEPVSDFNPYDPSCQKLGLVQLDNYQLSPGIQFYAPFAVRSWEYAFLPAYLRSNYTENGTLHNWFGPMRERAHHIVNQFYKFKPHLVDASFKILPNNTQCLGLHIRHSDKAGIARRKLPVEEFLPFIEAYLKNGGDKVYLATDSSLVEEHIRQKWPESQRKLIVQNNIIRSNRFKPVFKIGKHNQTNTEVLVEILSLSRCQFLVHGFSAVSESAIYLNLQLHVNSVDLEDPGHQNPEDFGKLVKRVLGDKLNIIIHDE